MSAFETGLMWSVYNDMEGVFLEFLDYVPPVQDHKKVYSYRLLRLMLQIGGYVDTAFKEMALYPKFDGNVKCEKIRKKVSEGETVTITLFRETFEPIYDLSSMTIFVKSPKHFGLFIDRFRPFQKFGREKAPKWWKAYNDVKHNWLKNLEKANVQNIFEALGGAFLLNAIHEPSLLELARRRIALTLIPSKRGLQQVRFAEEQLNKMIKRETSLLETKIVVNTRLFSWILAEKRE